MEQTMRKALTALAAVAALGAASASAASMNSNMMNKATGTIQSIDRSTDQIKLNNGSTFNVAKSVSLAKLTKGEKVTVTYTQAGKAMNATEIKPAA
jgi:Cu/Ag efflux protein CusF